MAKLGKQRIYVKSASGEVIDFESIMTAYTDGTFRMTFPKGIFDGLDINEMERTHKVDIKSTLKGGCYVESKELNTCKKALQDMCKKALECETREEFVILYETSNTGMYRIDSEKIELCKDYVKSFSDCNYSIGLKAAVYKKIIYSTPKGLKVKYFLDRETAYELNKSSCNELVRNFYNNEKCGGVGEILYTPEAEKFFLQMLIRICQIAENLKTFFGVEENILKAIENDIKLLGGGG